MNDTPTITLAITGAAGRMGMRLVALSRNDAQLKLIAAIDRPIGSHVDQDAGEVAGVGKIGLPLTIDLQPTPAVLVDFTTPSATRHWLKTCRDRGIAMVIGTTGLTEADHETIDQAGRDIPVLQAANTSLGVNLLLRLVADAARRLGDDYDIEIVEGHHRFKKDAPSGTAMAVANAILSATGKGKDALVFDRHGSDVERQRGQIGVHALRIGDEVGRHTTYFATLGERLELTHVATNRDTFALGALRAAKWLAPQKPGRYSMGDVLGL